MRISSASSAMLAALLLVGRAVADGNCQVIRFAELPVTMSGLRPLVPVTINGTQVMFLADSGSFWSLLTPAAANDLKLRLRRAPVWLNAQGANGSFDVHLTTVRELGLAKAQLSNVEFLVGGSEIGAGAAGVLGQNVFHLADVEYDLANGVIRLIRTKGCRGVAPIYWQAAGEHSEMKIDASTTLEPHTTGAAYLNGMKLRVMFDTGAATSMIVRKAAERAGVNLSADGVTDGGYTGGAGRKLYRTWLAPVTTFKIGDEEIRNTRLRIADTSLPGADMLVGADFFLSHRILVATDQGRLYFTYNGGPVFNLAHGHAYDTGVDASAAEAPAAAASATTDPADAAGYARRGSALMARGEYDRASADLTRATNLAPDDAAYQYQLGLALYRNKQLLPALAALDESLRLKPDDPQVLEARAGLRFYGGDRAGARVDADAVDRLLPHDSDLRRDLARTYVALGLYEQAVSQIDAWLGTHPNDDGVAGGLNNRCWARALWNRDLQGALIDCNEALKRSPKSAPILDSRGLVRLRLGDYAGALTDYDAGLAINPKSAWSWYGRGIAKKALGRVDESKADIDAAVAADPDIRKKAAMVGLVP